MTDKTKAEVEKLVVDFLKMIGEERYDVELRSRKSKSRDANSYLWVICTKISQRVEGARPPKEDVYRDIVKAVGKYSDKPVLAEEVEDRLEAWERQGIGFFTEYLDHKLRVVYYEWNDKTFAKQYYVIRHYYGSSTYNNEEMSILIDEAVYRAKELGIETLPPDEVARLKALWGTKGGEPSGGRLDQDSQVAH